MFSRGDHNAPRWSQCTTLCHFRYTQNMCRNRRSCSRSNIYTCSVDSNIRKLGHRCLSWLLWSCYNVCRISNERSNETFGATGYTKTSWPTSTLIYLSTRSKSAYVRSITSLLNYCASTVRVRWREDPSGAIRTRAHTRCTGMANRGKQGFYQTSCVLSYVHEHVRVRSTITIYCIMSSCRHYRMHIVSLLP